jgi:hypothetical protein
MSNAARHFSPSNALAVLVMELRILFMRLKSDLLHRSG